MLNKDEMDFVIELLKERRAGLPGDMKPISSDADIKPDVVELFLEVYLKKSVIDNISGITKPDTLDEDNPDGFGIAWAKLKEYITKMTPGSQHRKTAIELRMELLGIMAQLERDHA